MSNLITTSTDIWTDDLFTRAPGASVSGVQKALENTFREFTKQSGAWVVELWDQDEDSGDPVPFNNGQAEAIYDFQAIIESIRGAMAGGDYPSGPSIEAYAQYSTIKDYWAWDILYVHEMSYFDEYTWDPDTTVQTKVATQTVVPLASPAFRQSRFSSVTGTGWPKTFKTFNDRPGAVQVWPSFGDGTAVGQGLVPWVALGFPRGIVIDSVPIIFERMWYEIILDGATAKLLSQQDKPYTNPVIAQYHARRFRNGIAEARDMARRQMSNSDSHWAFPAWA